MKRRTFLKALGVGAALIPAKTFAADFIGAVTPQTYPVITGIDASTSVPHLIAVLDTLWERNIPVTCVVSPFDAEGQVLSPQHPVARVLAGYLLGGSGIEVAPFQADLATLSQHFQARAARDVLQALREMLNPVERTLGIPIRVQTLACHDVTRPASPTAVRSAGVFNILSLPQKTAAVVSETWENGVARLFGGTLVDLANPVTPAADARTPTQNVAYLSANAFSDFSVEDLTAAAEQFAESLVQQEVDGSASLLPVSDLQLRDAYDFKRNLCLHLMEGASETPSDTPSALANLLDRLKLPYSSGVDAGPQNELAIWVPTEMPTSEDDANPQPHTIEITGVSANGTPTISTTRPLSAGIAVRLSGRDTAWRGIGEDGVLTLSRRNLTRPITAESLQTDFAGLQDMVIVLRDGDFTDDVTLTLLERQLINTLRAPVTQFTTLTRQIEHLVPNGPLPYRYRRVAAAQPELISLREKLPDQQRAELMEDARAAWRYLERFTHPKTGLCPSTVDSSPGGRLHEAVTMWDVGSQINGLVAAKQIGLLDEKGFETAIKKILPNIAGRVSQDRRLPQGWIRTDRARWGNKNFDGSDAGRLLASLDNLRRHSGFGEQLVELVGSYDLDKIIIDGEIHSVTEGELHSSYVSHSAHYSALAFRRWGHAARSPYEVYAGKSEPDGQMALLEAVARIGPIGAEPLLLEGLELGMSRQSAYLADVLFTTQLEDYRETGRLICVSEGPIDTSPWFLYQGLQLDAETRTWAMDTVGSEPEYRTPEFRDEYLAVSSKAAYLWSAMQPHSYSDTLREYVRNTAKTENGFSSSIFVKSGRPTRDYTDLNTNSIILQAIAHQLETSG
ncbi:DUF3131 domain-containing protein [Rhodobacteraceae bacterium R_SAG3]|nr:DUF3131 domain-containing protein [Rhodobacteraceae bacterium R_SAG3]